MKLVPFFFNSQIISEIKDHANDYNYSAARKGPELLTRFNLYFHLTDAITIVLSMSQGQMITLSCIQSKTCYRSSKLLSQKLYSLFFKMLST